MGTAGSFINEARQHTCLNIKKKCQRMNGPICLAPVHISKSSNGFVYIVGKYFVSG